MYYLSETPQTFPLEVIHAFLKEIWGYCDGNNKKEAWNLTVSSFLGVGCELLTGIEPVTSTLPM